MHPATFFLPCSSRFLFFSSAPGLVTEKAKFIDLERLMKFRRTVVVSEVFQSTGILAFMQDNDPLLGGKLVRNLLECDGCCTRGCQLDVQGCRGGIYGAGSSTPASSGSLFHNEPMNATKLMSVGPNLAVTTVNNSKDDHISHRDELVKEVWKEKLPQRGGVLRNHINKSVTHIFANDLKVLEDRVGLDNRRKLRATLLRYEWLENCLKAGHLVAVDPYLLTPESEPQNLDESEARSTSVTKGLGSSQPSSVELTHNAEVRKRGEQSDSDEAAHKQRKLADDWMSAIHRGAKAGVLGKKGMNTSQGDGEGIADSLKDSVDLTTQKQSQTEMTYSPPNKNKNITDIFDEMRTIYGDALGDDRRSFSYRKVNSMLEKLPYKITSVDEVKRLPTVGKSMQEHIAEILTTGTMAKLEHFKQDEKIRAISQFATVWGIGPTTARKLYDKGHRTLNDLANDQSLSSAQRIGLKFLKDINTKIPRHEVQEMETLVRTVAESIDGNVMVVCGGSYRRGKALVGDMDIVITHPDGESHAGFLRKLIQKLKGIEFLTEDLLLGLDHGPKEERPVDTYFGLCKYPGRELRHRIDFKIYPYEKYPFGIIAWTGNDVLNRRLRILATSKGYRLDDHGCFPVTKDASGESVADRRSSVPCKTEREVFDFLGFEWLEPHERNL